MKFLLVCSVCIVFSSAGGQENLQSNSTVIKNSNENNAEQNTFEVFSLNSYDHQNPLIIRSNIPEQLIKPSEGNIKNGDNSCSKNINLPASRLDELTLPLPYSHTVFSPELPSYSLEGGLSNVEVVPTFKIDSLSELTPLVTSERPFAAGVSFDSTIPQHSSLNAYTGVSSQFFYPAPPPEPYSHIFRPSPNVQSHVIEEPHNYYGYIIKQVPEVASFIKPGIFTEADIPTIAELEAIFNKRTSSEFQPIVIDARLKGGESSSVSSNAKLVDKVENSTATPVPVTTESVSSTNESIWDFVNANSSQTSGVENKNFNTVAAGTDDADSTLVSQNALDTVFHGNSDLKAEPVDENSSTLAYGVTLIGELETTTLTL
ncbi:uncharacterized protein [Euwallacea fornicatus]|uniref:uncharacterized protein n=1 Tax=Euwallacea fornicatus TaxID=995702 RepID=UPI0033903C3B